MTLQDVNSFGTFVKWLLGIPGSLMTVIKEGGEESAFSSRRVALGAAIFGGAKSLPGTLEAVVEIARIPGSSWMTALVPIVPFALCVAVVVVIAVKITATDIAEIAGKLKG